MVAEGAGVLARLGPPTCSARDEAWEPSWGWAAVRWRSQLATVSQWAGPTEPLPRRQLCCCDQMRWLPPIEPGVLPTADQSRRTEVVCRERRAPTGSPPKA